MVNLKPEKKLAQVAPTVDYRSFRFQDLWLFVLSSAIVHGLLLLFVAHYETNQQVNQQQDNKPIDFVVVSPEEAIPEPTPETKQASESKIPPQEIVTQPAPAPEAKPTPPIPTTPAPTPTTKPATKDLIAGSDNVVTNPAPQKKAPKPIATGLAPKSAPSTGGSAADLLGGDYQKTLANNGAAFFSPEALSFESVLSPDQLQALKDFDLEAYQKKVYNKVKRNWHPNRYTSEKYSTWLTFKIQANGQVTELKIVQGSGSEEFDRAALAAIQKAIPLDPLPADFPLESLPFKYQFYLY